MRGYRSLIQRKNFGTPIVDGLLHKPEIDIGVMKCLVAKPFTPLGRYPFGTELSVERENNSLK